MDHQAHCRPPGPGDACGAVLPYASGFIRFTLGLLLAYTLWAWAGLRPSFHWGGVGIAVVLLVALVRRSARALVRDPVFYAGLAFLGLLAIQWANAGRVQYFDVGYQKWMYTVPPWPRWPSAFVRAEARQMLTWFFPAWVIVWTFRAGPWSRRQARGFLRLLAYNAGALAVFGLVQMASGTRAIYWVRPLNGHFFASFPYGNHVGPFFVLAGALSAGLLLTEVMDKRDPVTKRLAIEELRRGRVTALAATVLLCLVAAVLGFSRTGIILAGGLLMFGLGYSWVRGWGLLTSAGRVNAAALTLAGLAVLCATAIGFGEKGLQREISLKKASAGVDRPVTERLDLELGGRPRFVLAAVTVWLEKPWFGWGGWGYKYRVAEHVSPEDWPRLEKGGWANVHVDLLQFLAEFGLVGVALLLSALIPLAVAWVGVAVHRRALWAMAGYGLASTLVASAVDIPFRSPAILYIWLPILAVVPAACRAEESWPCVTKCPRVSERTGS